MRRRLLRSKRTHHREETTLAAHDVLPRRGRQTASTVRSCDIDRGFGRGPQGPSKVLGYRAWSVPEWRHHTRQPLIWGRRFRVVPYLSKKGSFPVGSEASWDGQVFLLTFSSANGRTLTTKKKKKKTHKNKTTKKTEIQQNGNGTENVL